MIDVPYAVQPLGAGPATPRAIDVPAVRGSGPALILAARRAVARSPKATLLHAPTTAALVGAPGWDAAVATAAELAVRGFLVLVASAGEPPAPGGWAIRPGRPLHAFGRHVAALAAVPDAATAATLAAAGAVAHAGVFVWRARTFLATAATLRPDWTDTIAGPDPDGAAYANLSAGGVEADLLQRAPERLALVTLASGANVGAR